MKKWLQNYTNEIGGQLTEYTDTHYSLIVPVSGGRFQTVIAQKRENKLYQRQLVYINSKVCATSDELNYKYVIQQTVHFNYCRFIIQDEYLQIEAVVHETMLSSIDTLREIIEEVANLADQYEMKLTGKDIQ